MLYYYAIFNVAKVLMCSRGMVIADKRIEHGLSVGHGYAASLNAPCPIDVYRQQGIQNGFERLEAVLGAPPSPNVLEVIALARQSVIGHRLLCQALSEQERFVAVRSGQLEIGTTNQQDYELIFAIGVAAEDLDRLQIQNTMFTQRVGLPGDWQSKLTVDGRKRPFTVFYNEAGTVLVGDDARSGAMLERLVHATKLAWHRVVTIQPPTYRRYYLYDAVPQSSRMPQALAAYALLFYFGSMNRYSPKKFRDILSSPCGPFVHEFLHGMPMQLLYLLGSELCRQELAHPSVVV